MKDLDLSDIDPLRWAKVRARVAAIESFLAIEHPTEAHRIEHAKRLGLGQTQFLKLVRAWQAHGTAVALAGAKRQRGPTSQWRAIPEQAQKVMAETLEGLGPDLKLAHAQKAVKDACHQAGLKAPSRQTIWRRLMAMRAARGSVAGAEGVIIATARAELPTLLGREIVLPSVILAVDLTNGKILAATVGFAQSGLKIIVDAVRSMDSDTVVIAEEAWAEALVDVPVNLRILTYTAARRTLARVMGKRLGPIQLLYAPTAKSAVSRLKARTDQALTVEDAHALIDDAIRQHNDKRAADQHTLVD